MIARHQQRVQGPTLIGRDLERAVDAVVASYARYYLESFRLPHLARHEVMAGLRADGFEHIEAAIDQGNGVIIALPHLGGWEWAGRWIAEQGLGITVVVEALDPPELFEWFASFRASLGMTVVPLGPEAGNAVLRALRANEVVCLLCDRDIAGGGIEARFFGEATRLPGGPATLALRTGAPILPTAIYFEGDGHLGLVRPPLAVERTGRLRDDVARITQSLTTEIETLIARAPEQWHLLQPNWPSDPGYRA